jgi:glyoxylase-like metal-dependent hydrolase (beta-lactamase superfamily II)
MGAIIDDEILYAADTLLFTNEGAPILPSVHARPVSLHAESLRALKAYLDLVFVPGHGAPVTDRAARERDLGNRIAYIEAIAASPGIALDEAQKNCDPQFLGNSWHEENYR